MKVLIVAVMLMAVASLCLTFAINNLDNRVSCLEDTYDAEVVNGPIR